MQFGLAELTYFHNYLERSRGILETSAEIGSMCRGPSYCASIWSIWCVRWSPMSKEWKQLGWRQRWLEFKTNTAFLIQIAQRNQILTFSRQHNLLARFHVRRYSAASQKMFQRNLTPHCSFQNLSETLIYIWDDKSYLSDVSKTKLGWYFINIAWCLKLWW